MLISMKSAKIKRHLEQNYPTLMSNPEKLGVFKPKREIMVRSRLDESGEVVIIQKGVLTASFQIANRIAKARKPHSIGEELILPCIKDAVASVLSEDASKKVAVITLADFTVQQRIVKMSDDIKE